jgi:hypothetical protein
VVKADFERLGDGASELMSTGDVRRALDDKPRSRAASDVYYDDLYFGFDDLPSRRADSPQR